MARSESKNIFLTVLSSLAGLVVFLFLRKKKKPTEKNVNSPGELPKNFIRPDFVSLRSPDVIKKIKFVPTAITKIEGQKKPAQKIVGAFASKIDVVKAKEKIISEAVEKIEIRKSLVAKLPNENNNEVFKTPFNRDTRFDNLSSSAAKVKKFRLSRLKKKITTPISSPFLRASKFRKLAPLLEAMAKHETGNFNSRLFKEANNMFGMGVPVRRSSFSIGSTGFNVEGVKQSNYKDTEQGIADMVAYLHFVNAPTEFSSPEKFVSWLKSKNYFTDSESNYLRGLKSWL
jgi:hypothetical protein